MDIIHHHNVLLGLNVSRERWQAFVFPHTLRCGNSPAWMLPFGELGISGHASANKLKYFDVRIFGTRNKCETPTWFNVFICNASVQDRDLAYKGPTYQFMKSVRRVYSDEDSPNHRTSPLKLGVSTVPAQIQQKDRLVSRTHRTCCSPLPLPRDCPSSLPAQEDPGRGH